MFYSSKAKSMYCAFLLLVQFLKGKKKKCKRRRESCHNIPFYLSDGRSAHCPVGCQAQASGPETQNSLVPFCMAWVKRNHQSQGKAVVSWLLKLKPVAPAGWIIAPQWKPRLDDWKEWGIAGSWATMTHTLRRSLRRDHQHQLWSKAVPKLLFLAGAQHFYYLGFRVFGCQTEPGSFSLKHSHQSYCRLSFGSLQVCSLEQRMRYLCVACEDRGPSLKLWCNEVSEWTCIATVEPELWDSVHPGNWTWTF